MANTANSTTQGDGSGPSLVTDRIGTDDFMFSAVAFSAEGAAPARVTDANGLPVRLRPSVTWLVASSSAAVSGDNTLVAAPAAGYRHVIKLIKMENETASEVRGLVEDGVGGTEMFRMYSPASFAGRESAVIFPDDGYRMTEATLLNLNLSDAQTVGYTVLYYLEATA